MRPSNLPSRTRRSLLGATGRLAFLLSLPFHVGHAGAALSDVSRRDAIAGLREALARGAHAAVSQLSARDGFLGDPRVRIPLPTQLQLAEGTMRRFGMGLYLDALAETLNRAAETAVSEATPLLLDSLKRMTLTDAKTILSGADDAATQYFRRSTGGPLEARFLPIVERTTARFSLKSQYLKVARRAARFGLISDADANLDAWVTSRALDGLWLVIADQERAIRADPVATGSALLKKVFGSLGASR